MDALSGVQPVLGQDSNLLLRQAEDFEGWLVSVRLACSSDAIKTYFESVRAGRKQILVNV